MENNELMTTAIIEHYKELGFDMEVNVEPPLECCVYRVPKDLRKVNEEAYTPKVISIGPLHHGKEELAHMEKQKIRYKREFHRRIGRDVWQEFITFIEKNEYRIRQSYAEETMLSKLEFITMILYDAVFIIELFLREHEKQIDFLINKTSVRTAIMIDLVLLENQLPYFVIKELYMLAFPNHNSNGQHYPSLFELSLCSLLNFVGIPEEVEVRHFTDLIRYVMTKKYPESGYSSWLIDLPSAVNLHKSGVKFERRIQGECLIDVRFEKKNIGIPFFEVTALQIPQFRVNDETECLIRNVMALEQCHYPNETHVCNFIHLMDFLINTEEDVNLLVERGVLYNFTADNARIADMFNKLCLEIDISPSCYSDIVKNLRDHYAKAIFKRVYFSSLWRATGTISGFVLLMLTLIQTICSILQVT